MTTMVQDIKACDNNSTTRQRCASPLSFQPDSLSRLCCLACHWSDDKHMNIIILFLFYSELPDCNGRLNFCSTGEYLLPCEGLR
jgi:hypothetical protein